MVGWIHPRFAARGQGLVEYALLLVLVAIVVLTVLALMGPRVQSIFCQITGSLGQTISHDLCDVVTITQATYSAGNQTLLLKATYNGSVDPGVTLTASPGGALAAAGNHYQATITLSGCPCTVTVTASTGASATVEVVP